MGGSDIFALEKLRAVVTEDTLKILSVIY